MAIQTTVTLIPGDSADIPVQCYDRAGNKQQFQASDTLSAGVRMAGASADAFAPTVVFYTKGGLQTGYDQGMILVSVGSTQSASFAPGKSYNLTVRRVLGSDNTRSESIARLQVAVEAIA